MSAEGVLQGFKHSLVSLKVDGSSCLCCSSLQAACTVIPCLQAGFLVQKTSVSRFSFFPKSILYVKCKSKPPSNGVISSTRGMQEGKGWWCCCLPPWRW